MVTMDFPSCTVKNPRMATELDSRSLAQLDQQFCWHPFTAMQEWCDPENEPVILVRGEGAYLWDANGRRYLDGNSSIWTNLHGHRHPKIDEAIRRQLEKVAHVSYLGTGNEPASLLAAELIGLFPEGTLAKVFYSDDGSTAIEVALKMALQFWQQNGSPEKDRFVAFGNAYHGDTAGASSLGGVKEFHERFGPVHFPVLRVESLEELLTLPELKAGRVAGVVIEPLVQGVNRVRLWPEGMLSRLREVCDEHGILLILDEILTGFGRTGTMFAHEQEKVVPDLLCLAKGLTGGYLPLAATLTTQRIFDGFLGTPQQMRTFFYGHSYTGNALGCAAALANLSIFREEDTLRRIRLLSECLGKELRGLAERSPQVSEFRQLGLIAGVDVVRNDGIPFEWEERIGFRVTGKAREFGLLTRNIGDTITLLPPFCSTEDQIREMVGAVEKAVEAICTG